SDRGRKRLTPSPPSELYVRFSRIQLSSWWLAASRLARHNMGFSQGKKSMRSEESIRPALMIGPGVTLARTLLLLAQQRPQPASHEAVHDRKGIVMRMFEVVEPPAQGPVQLRDHLGEALTAGAARLLANAIEEPLPALPSDAALSRFKPITQEVEPLPRDPTIPDMGLVRMQGQAVGLHP